MEICEEALDVLDGDRYSFLIIYRPHANLCHHAFRRTDMKKVLLALLVLVMIGAAPALAADIVRVGNLKFAP